jgi:hypothetical protein
MSLEDLEPLYGVAKVGFDLKVLEQLIKLITLRFMGLGPSTELVFCNSTVPDLSRP